MRKRPPKLTPEEVRQAFEFGSGAGVPVILTPAHLADLLHVSIKTVYAWMEAGRLDGATRKRGKRVFIWRDRVLDILFNGKDWS